MSKLLRATAWKAGVAILGGCCLGIVIVAGASATATKSASTSTPPPVDHQLCYTAAGTFKVPTNVRLIDQFSPNGFIPTIGRQAVLHCNPVIKFLPSGKVFKVTNSAAHLACFPMQAPKQPMKKVLVTNQFGQATLFTNQPNLFCVPSWKSLTGPPNKSPSTPPRLNHFTCYQVDSSGQAYKPPAGLRLQDEFTKKSVPVQVNPVPSELCLPTEKIVGKKTYPIINPSLHLLCFAVSKTPIRNPVWDENQFGTAKMTIKATKFLCLPSTKRVLPTGTG
jgi:hypothetical protein